MEERRLKFFLALQDEVEKSKNLSVDVKEKFYALAGKYLNQANVNIIDHEDIGMFRTYKEEGFIAIQTDDLEVSVKNKKKLSTKDDSKFDLKYHKPKEVTAFLLLFRSDDHPFKYLVHDYTKPGEFFDLDSFNAKIERAFKLETLKYSLPTFLYKRIKAFIGISNETWYFRLLGQGTDFSFQSEQLKKWVQENPKTHPIFGFTNEISLFKASIRIERNFKNILTHILKSKSLDKSFDIEPMKLEGATFFTDVDALASGLGAIFNAIAQRVEEYGRQLRISFEAKSTSAGRLRILKITHIGSRCNQMLREDELLGGDLKDAKKYLYKLCDWSILSENPDPKINKLNILFDPLTNVSSREKVNDPIDGFTHVLTFYS